MTYQERYLKHQQKKRNQLAFSEGEKAKPYTLRERSVLADVLGRRRSQRVFIQKEIPDDVLESVLASATIAPNSCNRHGLRLRVVRNQTEKDLLTGVLVGGIGWVHRANAIILFLADPVAYASPNEKDFMHYCDVGFTAMSMWLTAETHNIGVSYINPNIREENKELFKERFSGESIFCGALALGYYERRALKADPVTVNELLV